MKEINISELSDEELIQLFYDTLEEVEARIKYGKSVQNDSVLQNC